MAFTNTQGRYASFGIVTSLPGTVIDSFWYIIDHYLKDVVFEVIRFTLKNNKGKIQVTFSQELYRNAITIDLEIPYDPFYPRTVLVIDKNGKETIALPDELSII